MNKLPRILQSSRGYIAQGAAFIWIALACFAFTDVALAEIGDAGDPPKCGKPSCSTCPPGQAPKPCSAWSAAGTCPGMPQWWISTPFINMRLEDEPLGYDPAIGPRISFGLSYRQRGSVPEDPNVFGVGTNWSCTFRSFVVHLPGTPAKQMELHRGGAGWIDYVIGAPNSMDGSVLTSVAGGWQIEYADGSIDRFDSAFIDSSGTISYHASSHADSAGNATTFTYDISACCYSGGAYTNQTFIACYLANCILDHCTLAYCNVSNCTTVSCTYIGFTDGNPCPATSIKLLSVQDADGRTTTLNYTNASFPNLITSVVDPFGRSNAIIYDASGYITSIVDVLSMPSSFVYDTGSRRGWITNMTTPYGSTAFRYTDQLGTNIYYGGVVFPEVYTAIRSSEIAPPTGGKHLYVYRYESTNFLSAQYSPVPSSSPFGNTFDNVDQRYFNSFEWDPLQFVHLSYNYLSTGDISQLSSSDYTLARMRHWLAIGDPPVATAPTRVLSVERAASQDGTTPGEITWFDYFGKFYGYANFYPTNNEMPSIRALVLPDGSTRYSYFRMGAHNQVTNEVATYTQTNGSIALRTNRYFYAANSVDLVQHVGPFSEQVSSNYFNNTHHQPDATYDAVNQQTLYTYNAARQVSTVVRPTGLTTINSYLTGADVNRLGQTVDLEINRTNSYTYYANGLLFSHTDERSLTSTNYWDDLQRLLGEKYPDGSTVSNVYTKLDLIATKDRLNRWNYAGFNEIRQKTAETNANGVVTRYGYCDCGALLFVTNAWNTAVETFTSFGYDYQGNRTYTYLPDDTVTNWFNSLRQITLSGTGQGLRYFYYNNQGLLTNRSSAYGVETATTFDAEDRPVWVADANGVIVTNTFDNLGRLRTRKFPDGGVESFGYSARGTIAHTNQINAKTFWVYDESSRKVFETNANLEVIVYTNNAAGDLLSVTDGKNQTTRWAYDLYGRVTNKVDQAGIGILRYNYNAHGELTNRWSAAKGNTYYSYDLAGNLTNINYPTSTDVRFTYDPLNRVSTMVDAVGTTVYSYTAGGQLLTEDGPFSSDTVTNTYQNRLRVGLGLQQPTGNWTNGFIEDVSGRVTNVTSQAGTFSYFYPSGKASLLTAGILLPNTAYITNSFDNVARMTGTYLKNNGSTILDSYVYAYDLASERTNVTRTDTSTVGFGYDAIGQLTLADSSVPAEDRGYFYDAAWNLNRRTNNGTVQTFGVDNRNQLTSGPSPVGDVTYDNNGNIFYSHSENWFYTYDDENRLTLLQTGSFGILDHQTEFYYDGLGRLRKRLEYHYDDTGGQSPSPADPDIGGPPPSNWILDSETRYIYDGKRVIQERDGSNNPLVSYTRGNDLSGSFEGAGGIGGLLARSTGSSGAWTTHNYYFADGNGNVTYLINSSQSMVASYRYDPFGNIISQSGTLADANVYRFSSKEFHASSGMYYYLYRFYDPNLQRWLSRDPIEEQGGLNLYVFVNNDPEDYFDAFGQQSNSPTPQPSTSKPPGVPPDPANPDNEADKKTREQFARAIMNQFQAWKNKNKCCDLDLCTLISQWMYESNWGRSPAARGKNLSGITGKGPEGSTGNFRKYKEFPQFYQDYTELVCKATRYKDAIGKKGQGYVDALKKAGYDATDANYGNNVMQIYKQLGCK
jgi:RHS repeat-associated protein